MLVGISMFWARLRLILAQAVEMSCKKGPKYTYAHRHNCITNIVT